MTEIGQILALLRRRSENPAVLITLTRVEGSSYRRPGARMLWLEDGTRTGGISGGCLEDDAIAHALEVLQSREPRVVVYDTTDENDLVWGTGTGCDGQVTLLLEYIPAPRPLWIQTLAENYRSRRPTVLEIRDAGNRLGTVLAEASSEPVSDGQPRWSPTSGRASREQESSQPARRSGSTKLTHGHEVRHEVILPPQRLIVCGAGDDAQPLVAMAAILGWDVTVMDSRPAHATPERFPAVQELICSSPTEAWTTLPGDKDIPVVIMTHRYEEDRILLRLALTHCERYVGLLGPRRRTERLLAELARDGFEFTEEMKRVLHAPVGLALGANTPAGVALAVLAEIQACLAQCRPTPLRDRPGPIHA